MEISPSGAGLAFGCRDRSSGGGGREVAVAVAVDADVVGAEAPNGGGSGFLSGLVFLTRI